MTASHEAVSDVLLKIGPSLAAHLSTAGGHSLRDKPDDSLFVALAWCEVIGTRVAF